ncbi:MAG: IS1380 family transposase [Thermoleophilia bacterium]|nr:IS1380 family transposase [Thermoleophilia bacterium]
MQGKKLEVDFDGGEVSSDAGVLLLREVERRLKLLDRLAKVLHDRRHPGYTRHSLLDMLKQRVFQIACGYEDAADADTLRRDPALKMACERLPDDAPLASQPTLSRLENAVSRTDLYRIAEVLVEAFIESYRTPPVAILLDIDDTEDTTHGRQQMALFNAFYEEYCYLPIHIYEGKSGKLVTTVLRPGKRPSGKEIVAILKRVVRKIRNAWPEVSILLRADSHYTAPEVIEFCETENLKYALGLAPNAVLRRKAAGLVEDAEKRFRRERQPVRLFGEFSYGAGSWEEESRVVVKAEHNALGANLRFVVTNLECRSRRVVYEMIYSDRGRMELMIKDHKTHLLSDRTSCHRFEANQFRLFLHSMAYVLLHALRRCHLQGTTWARAQFDTIRLQVLKIGARVRQLRTRVKVHLPTSYPWQAEWRKAFASCRASP